MMTPQDVRGILGRLGDQIGQVVFGSQPYTRLSFIALLARGHILIEGVPGTGKTLFAKCFGRSLGLETGRIQCTPDLMPGDVIGANIFDFRNQSFSLIHGPVFTELLLADEINRTPPKAQAALLEAMQERAVTIDGKTHSLSSRFTVIATQNPVEHEGTYPLPEAQLDRFMFKLDMGYPGEELETEAVLTHCTGSGMPDLDALGVNSILGAEELDLLRRVPASIRIEPDVARYAVALGGATRAHAWISVGLSPRATTVLATAARAAAACEGRDYVVPDDVKSLFVHVGRHRVVLEPTADIEGVDADTVLEEIASTVPAPR